MSIDNPDRWTGKHVLALRDNALRLTQSKFSDRALISPRAISKYENHPDDVLTNAAARRLDAVLLTLTDEQRARFRAALSDPAETATLTPNDDGFVVEEVDLVAMARRGFLLGVGLGAGSTALTSRWMSSAGHVPVWLAESLRETSAAYRAAYRLAPARQLLAAAHGHLQLVISLRPADQPEPVRTHLLTVAGEMAATAGIIQGLDLGDWTNGQPYLRVAQTAATASGNNDLCAVVAACHAFHAAYHDDPEERDLQGALDYADSARSLAAQGGSPTTQGWVAAVASERYADLGDVSTSLRLLDEARVALDQPPVAPVRYSGIGAFDTAKLTAYQGSNYRRAGDFNRAVAVLDTALAQLDPSMHRHRATALIDRAEAQRDARRFDAACADARSALVLVSATHHAGTLTRAEQVARSVRHAGRDAQALLSDVLAVKATISS